MKVVVLNGSPKGEYSISYQYARYWEYSSNENSFITFNIGSKINQIENDKNELFKIFDEIENADFVLWAYPVYTSLVPYQVMRFVELIIENGKTGIFGGKFTSQIVTSKHFYDHTAYNFLKQYCDDWDMKVIHGHLADMMDLKKPIGQKRMKDFISEINWMVSYENNSHNEIKTSNKVISIVTDAKEEDINLNKMIETYSKNVAARIQFLNLNDINLKSGCLGCLYCTMEGECAVKDDFRKVYNSFFDNSDGIIYALSIKNRSFGSLWKKFEDRQFSNGHRLTIMGKSVGYLVSGNLTNEPNLKEVLQSRVEVGHTYLLDIITDESSWDNVSENIKKMAKKTDWALENKPERPLSFLGVGGMRVFRDLVYTMRGMMKEDHLFYKKHKLYDFPHKDIRTVGRWIFLGFLMKSKKMRVKIFPKMKEIMLKPFGTVLDDLR